MPPRKELCRNFLRGSCQYGDRCKFLHAAQTPAKPNPFGFGLQTSNQFQQTNVEQQKPNPFGFGVQHSSQPRGPSDFGSKQNQFKPFENKWIRSSQANTGSSAASRQPDNQPPSHKCTDPESCKRQILEDFENERPLWKLTCYGHSKYGPCDIFGDISYEELRATAYDDAKRGLSLQSIVERERNLLNSKLVEFDSLLHSPYKGSSNSAIGLQSPSPISIRNNTSVSAQNSNPPLLSSFSQLGTSLGGGATASPNNFFGQQHAFQSTSQASSMVKMTNSPFQNSGFGSQLPSQTLQSPFASSSASFGNSSVNAVQNPFSTSTVSSQSSIFGDNMNGLFSANANVNEVGLSRDNIDLNLNMPEENLNGDNSIWRKEEWSIGEIPEAEPPVEYCR